MLPEEYGFYPLRTDNWMVEWRNDDIQAIVGYELADEDAGEYVAYIAYDDGRSTMTDEWSRYDAEYRAAEFARQAIEGRNNMDPEFDFS